MGFTNGEYSFGYGNMLEVRMADTGFGMWKYGLVIGNLRLKKGNRVLEMGNKKGKGISVYVLEEKLCLLTQTYPRNSDK